MKKLFERIVTVALAFTGILFVALLLVIMFKPDYAANLTNELVRVLVIIFSAIFGVLTALNIAAAFTDNEKISNVLLFKAKSGATKATIGVIKKTAARAAKQVEGARLKKVTLFVDENNDVRMKVDLKVKSADIEETVTKVRATMVNVFFEILGLEFTTIDFRLVSVKNNYVANSAEIDKKVAEFKSELQAEREKAAAEKAEREAAEVAAKTESEVIKTDAAEEAVKEEIAVIEELAADNVKEETVAAETKDEIVTFVRSEDEEEAKAEIVTAEDVVVKEVDANSESTAGESTPSAEEVIENEVKPE